MLIVVFKAVQRSVYLLDYHCGFIKVFFCDFGIFKLVKEFCHLFPKHFVSPWTALDYNITLERSVYQIRLLCLTGNSGQTLYLFIFLGRDSKGYSFNSSARKSGISTFRLLFFVFGTSVTSWSPILWYPLLIFITLFSKSISSGVSASSSLIRSPHQ